MKAFDAAADIPEDLRKLRSSWGRGRPESCELLEDVQVAGVPCRAGKASFHPNGRPKWIWLATQQVLAGHRLTRDTSVQFDDKGAPTRVTLGQDQALLGREFAKGSEFYIGQGRLQTTLVQALTVAGTTYVTGTGLNFRQDGSLVSAYLTESHVVQGVRLREQLFVHPNGQLAFGVLDADHLGYPAGAWLGWSASGALVGARVDLEELRLQDGVVTGRRNLARALASCGGYGPGNAMNRWGIWV